MLLTPKEELNRRIKSLQVLLQANNLDGALIAQAVDLYYFSGTAQNAHLYIPAEGGPVLMVRKSLARARKESALERVEPLTSLKKMPEIIAGAGLPVPGVLGLEMDVIPANNYVFYSQIFKDAKTVDVSNLIRQVRQIKSEYEIELMREAARKLDEVYSKIPEIIREGMTEIELAAKIESIARSNLHMGSVSLRSFLQPPFMGHVLSGWSGAVPSAFDGPTGGSGLGPLYPQGAGVKTIGRGEPIIVDFAGVWNGYTVDQTRCYSIGPLNEQLSRAFEISLAIQSAVIGEAKPGLNGSRLHELAIKMASEAGLADHFMGYVPDQARFLGHGVGLELDELPVLAAGLDVILQPGMVFAIEPKFIFPGEGAVGIENTFLVTGDGVERITLTPDELVII